MTAVVPTAGTLASAFAEVAETMGDRLALALGEERWTYRHLDLTARRLAAGLRALGVAHGDRVLMIARNRPEHALWVLATTRLGALHTAIHPGWTEDELRRAFDDAEPAVVVAEADALDTVTAAARGTAVRHVLCLDDAASMEGLLGHGRIDADHAAAQDDCTLWYTSGTSGRPKGVVWTHRAFLFNAFAINRALGTGPSDVGLRVSPVAHNGMSSALMGTMMCGAPVHLLQRFDARRVIEVIQRESVTWTNLVPAAARLLLDAAEAEGVASLPSLRRVLVGAAPTPPATLERLAEFLPNCAVVHGYGATEGYIAVCPPQRPSRVDGTVGLPLPGTEVKVVGLDGGELPRGEVGRIVFRNEGTLRCYWRNPELTAKVRSADGWIDVGDLGHMNEDGWIWVSGREHDVINVGGYNVYASEVEAALERLPGVGGAAVVGVPHELLGEVPVAFVEATPGAVLDEEAVAEGCARLLARYKRPARITVLAALPRNSYGKVQRRQLVRGEY